MPVFCLLTLLFLFPLSGFSTHNLSGEITWKHISGYTYEICIVTYTESSAPADRDSLPLNFGNDTTNWYAPRIKGDLMPCNGLRKNIYVFRHTFPGNGAHRVIMNDPNRRGNLTNVPNSASIHFVLQAEIIIDNTHPGNSSPQFLATPVFYAYDGNELKSNVTVSDPEGDSLSFALDSCLAGPDQPTPGYFIPANVTLNPLNGELTWDQPSMSGMYSFAVKITQWKNGVPHGYVWRDFVIAVAIAPRSFAFDSLSAWPKNTNGDYEVRVAPGTLVSLQVRYTDQVSNTLEAYGEPFTGTDSASFTVTSTGQSKTGVFQWIPGNSRTRNWPYITTFRGISWTSTCFFADVTLMVYVDPAVGMNEPKILPYHRLYPNPSSGKISFDYSLAEGQTGELVIMDMTGKPLSSYRLCGGINILRINESSLPDGIYFYRMTVNEKVIKTDKFSIIH